MQDEGFGTQFLYALSLTLSITSTTGYGNQISMNNNEKIFFVFLIVVGDALFAIGFGLIASSVNLFPEKFREILVNFK